MLRPPPRFQRTDTLFPSSTLFRSHRKAGAHNVADHTFEPERFRLPRDRGPFGQPAAFIELDIDDVEASDERGGVDERQRAFIGDEGQRPFESVEIGFAPAPQRLFELRDAMLDKRGRSEEHTSELQSLMRISYAVFCLKKKKNTHTTI